MGVSKNILLFWKKGGKIDSKHDFALRNTQV